MSISLINPWHWADDSFRDPLDWLINHPRNIKRGTYLSNTPGKEVWQYTLPKGFGNLSIIYKYYDYTRFSPLKRFGYSLAVREAQNFAAFKAIGIPVSEILACGENKHCGVLRGAFLISRSIPNSHDGSVLTPTGNLWDHTELKMGFCKRALQNLATLHQSGGYYTACHPNKILFPKDCNENNLELTWIDVANCNFFHKLPMKQVIPNDLVQLFVDLRLSTDQIKQLCNHYLRFNPNCGYSVPTLWNELVKIKPQSMA